MDCLGAAAQRHLDDCVAAQVGIGRARSADRMGDVGLAHVLRGRVGFRVDGDGPDAEAAATADHATGDFAAVGDQDPFEHALALRAFVGWLR